MAYTVITNVIHFLLTVLLSPVLGSIWIIEELVRAYKRDGEWQINSYQVTPLFLILSGLCFYLIFIPDAVWPKILGAFIATSMEILALALSFVVGLGKSTRFHALLQMISDRKRKRLQNTRDTQGVYRVAAAYIYNIYYFGLLYNGLLLIDPTSFSSLRTSRPLDVHFDMFYYSASVLTLFTNPFPATSITAKILTILEVFVGLIFMIYIFSSIIAFHVNRTRD